ncbi:hypothetical protein [Nocardia xishanensis]|uniref:hypothetical protein n=1 Tax=Nocardia xishanensis TaxID=238964 RepID=UPI00083425A9|nr:hypothetical protein [Nocardia xishanensis]
MAFEPIYMVSPAGVRVLVGSAVERETLRSRGYTLATPEPEPVRKPAPVAKPVDERATSTPKTSK